MVTNFEFPGHVVGILVDRDVTSDYFNEVHSLISEKIAEYGKINLYCEIERDTHIPFLNFLKDLRFKYKNDSHFKVMVIVTDNVWFKNAMEIKDLLLNTEIRTYNLQDRLEALNWISQ